MFRKPPWAFQAASERRGENTLYLNYNFLHDTNIDKNQISIILKDQHW